MGSEMKGQSPLEQAIGREMAERYERALAQLQPEERELIIARVETGLHLRGTGRVAREADDRRGAQGGEAGPRPPGRGDGARGG